MTRGAVRRHRKRRRRRRLWQRLCVHDVQDEHGVGGNDAWSFGDQILAVDPRVDAKPLTASQASVFTVFDLNQVRAPKKKKEKSTPAKRPRALRKGSLTSKLARVSPNICCSFYRTQCFYEQTKILVCLGLSHVNVPSHSSDHSGQLQAREFSPNVQGQVGSVISNWGQLAQLHAVTSWVLGMPYYAHEVEGDEGVGAQGQCGTSCPGTVIEIAQIIQA
eukprot:1144962-Pelagomonas_calceolata.AAC.1